MACSYIRPSDHRYLSTMKALVYRAVNAVSLQDRPIPTLSSPTDAIIKVTKTTICGTDLHIRKGDVATCQPGRVLGHEGVGIVHSTGSFVTRFKKGDRVLISCISSCATCEYCRKGMYSHCISGGWILGNTIDGTQAEFVRVPFADSSLYAIPPGADEAALVMLSDIFPTGLECGVLNGKVQPGGIVAIVGSGPIGLAALVTAQMYSPSKIIIVDMDAKRLEVAKHLGATKIIDSSKENPVASVMAATDGKGCDSVVEAVGIPATFELCQELLAPGGTLANVGVHGTKADLHLQKLWDRNIFSWVRQVEAKPTHHASDMEKAYETFGKAAQHGALKVVIDVD
ncbi:alcohol dehydrogenase [Fusarium oxysporum f. sp. lycopersici 4287]|uniref:Enoyl reductase (ER) domain-containing protein n=3 Tax=Fusarium oxysporum TaxID=5507 RepID=A0A0D2YI76_FUSOF|nr:alcohol dehydrogenase [Fusarium oxysporum f. sp. lycopersici 4287]KNB18819.1 alcohol dehydrogenase [Fusarium oxysporum f. sp. lycopersici 4287]